MAEGKTTVMELTEDQIQVCFTKYDADSSGDLDTFELSNAVTELLNGVVPTTSQVTAMVALSGAQDNKLSRDQFSSLIKQFDWSSAAATAALGALTYEHVFQEKSLGFRVRSVAGRGIIVVSKVVEPSLAGVVNENDTVVAVNGAPLGFVTDHKVLQEKIKPLRRPVRVTFQKYVEGSSDAMGMSPEASSAVDYAPVGDSTTDGESDQASLSTATGPAGGVGASSLDGNGSIKSGGARPTTLQELEAVETPSGKGGVAGVEGEAAGRGVPEPSPRSAATMEAVAAGRRRAEADAAQEEDETKSRRSSSSGADNNDDNKDKNDDFTKQKAVNSPPLSTGNRASEPEPISALKDAGDETGAAAAAGGGGGAPPAGSLRKDWPHEVLYSAFQTFDRDRSGNLDTFELGPCLRELLGTTPSTAVVHALVDRYDQGGNGTVDLVNFIAMMRDFDWSVTAEASEHAKADAKLLQDQGLYEVDFHESMLGFKVRNDPGRPGEIAVSAIMDSDNEGRIHLGDSVLAVNGAPLGYANDHRILAFKIKDLSRPLRLTFRRNFNEAAVAVEEAQKKKAKEQAAKQQQQQAGSEESKHATGEGGGQGDSVESGDVATNSNGDYDDDDDDDDASVLSISVASLDRPYPSLMADASSFTLIGNGFTFEQLSAAFRKFDVDFSNALDTFELSACLMSLVKRPITTPEMVRLVHEFDEHETNTLDFGEFLRMFREHDFSKEVEEELGEGVYEVSFAEQSLGIKVANVPVKDPTTNEPTGDEEITVIEIVEPSLVESGVIAVGDAIIAVNGAPLAAVGHHRALADKIAPLGRPLRLTFTMSAARLAKLAKLAARAARAEAKEEAQRRRAEASALASGVDVSEVPELQPRARTPSRTLSSRVSSRVGSFDEPSSPKSPKDGAPPEPLSPARGRTLSGSSSKPGTPNVQRPSSRTRPNNGPPKLGWKAAMMAVDLEKIKVLKAKLQELSLSESKRGDGSTFSRSNSMSSSGGWKRKKIRRASLSDQGHEIVPLGDAAAPSLEAQACLIEAGKLCLKLVKRNVLGGRMDTSTTLRTACVLLDRAMAGSELPGCYANRPEPPPTRPTTVTAAAMTSSSSSSSSGKGNAAGSPVKSRRSRSPSEPFYSPGIPTKVIGRHDSIRSTREGSDSDDGNAPDDGEDGPDGAPLPEKEASQEERQSCADGYYWAALAEAHWRCFEMGGLRGEGVHLVRAAEAYARATHTLSHMSDIGLWLQSLKPLVSLGAWERAAHTCSALPDMPLSAPDLPPSFQFQAAELFVALSMHETAHSYLFAAFVETGPPVSLKPEHLLFALGRVFNMWHRADLADGDEGSGHGDHAAALLMQACQLTMSAKAKQKRKAEAAAVSAASGTTTAAAGGDDDEDDDLPEVTPEMLTAWLADGATLRAFGDAYTAAGFHLLAHDCYHAAVHDCGDSEEARKPVAWYRLAKSCFFSGRRPEAVAALTKAVELQGGAMGAVSERGSSFDGESSAKNSASSSRRSSTSGGYAKLLAEWREWDEPGYDGGAWVYERELRQPLDKLASRLPVLGEDHDSAEANGAASTLSASFRSHRASKQPLATLTNANGLQQLEEQAPRLYRSNSELENVQEFDGENLADELLNAHTAGASASPAADPSPASTAPVEAGDGVAQASTHASPQAFLPAPSQEPSVQEAALVAQDEGLNEAAPKFARQPSMQDKDKQDEATQQQALLRDLNAKLAVVEAERDAAKALAVSSQAQLQEALSRPETPAQVPEAQAPAQALTPAATAVNVPEGLPANDAASEKAAVEAAANEKAAAEKKAADEAKAAGEKAAAEAKAAEENKAAEEAANAKKESEAAAKARAEAEAAAAAAAAAAAREAKEYQKACEEASVGRTSQTPAMRPSAVSTDTRATYVEEAAAASAARTAKSPMMQSTMPAIPPGSRGPSIAENEEACEEENEAAEDEGRAASPAAPKNNQEEAAAVLEMVEETPPAQVSAATSDTIPAPAAPAAATSREDRIVEEETTFGTVDTGTSPVSAKAHPTPTSDLYESAPTSKEVASPRELPPSAPETSSAPAPEASVVVKSKAEAEEAQPATSTVDQTSSDPPPTAELSTEAPVATPIPAEKEALVAPSPSANEEPAEKEPAAPVAVDPKAAALWEGWRVSNTDVAEEAPEGYAPAPTSLEMSSCLDEQNNTTGDTVAVQPPTAAEVARMPAFSKQLETEQLEVADAQFKLERRESAMRASRPSIALVVSRERESWEEDLSVEKLELMESPTRVVEPREELLAPPGDSSIESQSELASQVDLESQRGEEPAGTSAHAVAALADSNPEDQKEMAASAVVSPESHEGAVAADAAGAAAAAAESSPEPPKKAKKPRKSKSQKAKEKHLIDKSPEAVRARMYRRMFVSLDVNQDGALTRVEIAAALAADPRLCAVVHEACGFPEGPVPPPSSAAPAPAATAAGGREGGEGATEAADSSSSNGEDSAVGQFDRVFQAIDLDATGDITFEEFVEFIVRRKAIMEAMVLQGGDPLAAIAAAVKADEKKKERDAMLAALFGAVDRNGDGDVTRSELMRALNNEAHLRVMLQKLLGLPSKVGTKTAKESFEMVFACVDRDNSHSIVVDELRTFLEDMDHMVAMQGDKSLPRDVQELLVSADKNQDGDLSPIEVIRALHAHPELLKALEMRKAQVAFLESEAKKAALLGAEAARKAAEKASRNRRSTLTDAERAAGMTTPLRMSTPVLQVPQAYERPLSSTSPPRSRGGGASGSQGLEGGLTKGFSGRLSPSDSFDASDALSRGSSFGTFSSDGDEDGENDENGDDMATTDASASTAGESTTCHTTVSDSVDYFSRDSAGQSQEGGRGGGGGDDGFSVASGNVSFSPEEQDQDWQRGRPGRSSGDGQGLGLPSLTKDENTETAATTSPGKTNRGSRGSKAATGGGIGGGKRGKAARLAAEEAAREQAQLDAARAAEEEARLEAQRLLPPIETPEQKKARLLRQKAEQEQQKAAAKRLARSGYRSQRQDTLDARIDAAMRATPGALPCYVNPSVAASLSSSFVASTSYSSSSSSSALSPPGPPLWPYQGSIGSIGGGGGGPEQNGSFSFGQDSAWYGNNYGGGSRYGSVYGGVQNNNNSSSSELDSSSLNLSGVLGPVAASSLVPYHQVPVVQLGAWARDSRDPELRRAARLAADVAAASMKRGSNGKGRGKGGGGKGGGGGSKKFRPAPMAEALRQARAARAPGGAAAALAVEEAAAQQRFQKQQQQQQRAGLMQQAHMQQLRGRSEGSAAGGDDGSQLFRTLSSDGSEFGANTAHLGTTQPVGSWGDGGQPFDEARF